MRSRLAATITALVLLFLLEGQRVLLAGIFVAIMGAAASGGRLLSLLPAVLLLLPLLLPLLPIPRWLERERALALCAGATAMARIGLSFPDLPVRAGLAAVVLGLAGLFLTLAVGQFGARTVAVGVAGAVTLDQLLRLAGGSYDLSLRAEWLPVQIVIALATLLLLVRWLRMPAERQEPGEVLERRVGGLRLRGGIALGALLFLLTSALAAPEVAARWSGVGYRVMALLTLLCSVAAVAGLITLRGPLGRHRPVAVTFGALVLLGILAGQSWEGWPAALSIAVAAGAGLLVLPRILAPATGRRRGGTVVATLLIFLLLHITYGFTFYPDRLAPALAGDAPDLLLVAAVMVIALLALLPRPGIYPAIARWQPVRGLPVLLIVGAFASLATLAAGSEADPRPLSRGDGSVRVASFDVRLGFTGRGRYDPEGSARLIAAADPDLILLREVPVGMSVAYGTDLPRWLARRLDMRAYFAPRVNGLLGDAFLTRIHLDSVLADRASRGALRLLLSAQASIDERRLTVHAVELGDGAGKHAAEIATLLAGPAAGPVAILGDFDAEAELPLRRELRARGFRSALELVQGGSSGAAAAYLRSAEEQLWVRELRVGEVFAAPGADPDQPLVGATLILP